MWTWTNILILSCVSAYIGHLWRRKDERSSMSSAMLNGFIVYFFVLSSAFVFTGSLPPTLQKDYVKKVNEQNNCKDDCVETKKKTEIQLCEEVINLASEPKEFRKLIVDNIDNIKSSTVSATVMDYIRFAIIVTVFSFLLNYRPNLLRGIVDKNFDILRKSLTKVTYIAEKQDKRLDDLDEYIKKNNDNMKHILLLLSTTIDKTELEDEEINKDDDQSS